MQKYFGNLTRHNAHRLNATDEVALTTPATPPSVDINTPGRVNRGIQVILPDIAIIPADNKPRFASSKILIQTPKLGGMSIPQRRRSAKKNKLHVRAPVDVHQNTPKAL